MFWNVTSTSVSDLKLCVIFFDESATEVICELQLLSTFKHRSSVSAVLEKKTEDGCQVTQERIARLVSIRGCGSSSIAHASGFLCHIESKTGLGRFLITNGHASSESISTNVRSTMSHCSGTAGRLLAVQRDLRQSRSKAKGQIAIVPLLCLFLLVFESLGCRKLKQSYLEEH